MKKFDNLRQAVAKALILCLLISVYSGILVYAKYVKNYTMEKATITITANLGQIEIKEHEAVKKDDGSYYLSSNEVDSNSYKLIPGLDIPKDPFVRIEGKSEIPAYVFIEVVTNIQQSETGIQFSLTDDWIKIDGVYGVNGGSVYYYKNPVAKVGDTTAYIIPILEPLAENSDDTIRVSQDLKGVTYLSDGVQTDFYPNGSLKLEIYACMGQVIAGQSPGEIYTALFKTTS